jgi:hypothetical protein
MVLIDYQTIIKFYEIQNTINQPQAWWKLNHPKAVGLVVIK